MYSHIKKGARAKEFEDAIQWLIDAGLVFKVMLFNKIAKPLKFYEDLKAFNFSPLMSACSIVWLRQIRKIFY